MRIGILALQGAFLEHETMLSSLAGKCAETIDCIEIRQKADLAGLDGVILPGGESTVQGKLLQDLGMFAALRDLIAGGLPTLATCAGLILLAEKIEDGEPAHLATLPVTVQRNAYGRQLGSFTAAAPVGELPDFPLVFIRAPYVTQASPAVNVLSVVDGRIVAVQYQNQVGLSFHPELTGDDRIHRRFLDMVLQRKQTSP